MSPRPLLLCAAVSFVTACATPPESSPGVDGTDPNSNYELPTHPTQNTAGGIPEGRRAVVERVVDGDTIVVYDGERIRLTGIDTPETVKPGSPIECFGKEASRYLAELLPEGTEVMLVRDVEEFDRYDRTLSYVYIVASGNFVNAEMVAQGYAYSYTYPPNVAHAEEFAEMQSEAQANNRGLWSACPVP